jgi:hypothetical protein
MEFFFNPVGDMMKKIIIISSLLISIIIISFIVYQLNKPILTQNEAIAKAKIYLDIADEKMHLPFDTKKDAESSWRNKDSFLNKVTGNRTWAVVIDGVGVFT